MIEDRIARCALGSFYRFPNVRLNQINWHAEMYAHFTTVTGVPDLLKLDYRQQVERFVNGITRPLAAGGSPNLGPGYRFHYLPHKPPEHGLNIDSAEYANMTCHFLIWYEQALRAGMAPFAPEQVRLLRAWVEHIVCGYWTHAGYLNWDTGFSFKRWHQGRTFALARQGLFAIALSPRFHNMPEIGQWAKYMFDAGFRLFARLARDAPDAIGIPPGVLFDLKVDTLGPSVRELFAARMQADAARAVVQGLERVPAALPPPLYSFDSDIGRLAVTTPSYSTAIVPVSQHALPYGGIEMARLHGSDAGPLSNIGGRPWASFGVVVRNAASRSVLRSQQPTALRRPCASPARDRELAAGSGQARAAIPVTPLRGVVHVSGGEGPKGIRGSRGRDDSPLSREVDRGSLEDHAPQAGALLGRRAVSELGQASRNRSRAARRAARAAGRADTEAPARANAQRGLLLHRRRGGRLRRRAGRPPARQRPYLQAQATGGLPQAGADAGDRAGRPREVQAARLRRPDRSGVEHAARGRSRQETDLPFGAAGAQARQAQAQAAALLT